ncbi:hypothetical protein PF005_g3615 [Phytophthora fragariae]|uniref:Uncharacterized protein n=1 Tax=Phytophthora fragariae TaxID=53985 RepID=A0A6A4ADS9_9STRA|nr:hypothetical protein PF011_g13864 [Phytophthora fragariae]KAE9230080.1 hypothetical protein PF005_g3615 [Phytophthora fragariae]KAE9254180.1 hypothetical protein PF002_g2983 [Phytophthora fragariae]
MKNDSVEQRPPYVKEAVEQGLPHSYEAVEQGLPHDDAARERHLSLEQGLESHEDVPPIAEAIEASPCSRESARDAKSITNLPGLSWKNFLRDLKAGDIEQVYLITDGDSVSHAINSVDSADTSSRSKSAEPKSAREERFAAQSWGSLKASDNPIYETAREFADVFPDKIPAELPADRGVRHDIDLAHGSKYCVTRQWPLPRDQVKAIDDFFEGRRQAGHVRESISPHSSPTF